jgi:dTDP-glucose 4,6-dehydratase
LKDHTPHDPGRRDATRVLVTGGAGFIGSAVIRRLITQPRRRVLNLDKLTYAASKATLSQLSGDDRYELRVGDICNAAFVAAAFEQFRPHAVMHLAAESHVDRSIDGPEAFLQTNVVGTMRMLEAARAYRNSLEAVERRQFLFHHVSTDEVFGALGPDDPPFSAATPYDPRSPYSASKAAADHLARAWSHTYDLPVVVTNCTNNYGPYHFPEKLIPLLIIKALSGQSMPVYGRGENVRDWLHVDDHADALVTVLERGGTGQTYFIGGGAERTNLFVATAIADIVDEMAGPISGAPRRNLITFVPDRPGHDFRYAMDTSKIADELGWRPTRTFEDGLRQTVGWYLENESWWRPLLTRYGGERLGGGTVEYSGARVKAGPVTRSSTKLAAGETS